MKFFTDIGDYGEFTAQQDIDCYNNLYAEYPVEASWTSSDYGVADMETSSGGAAAAVGIGKAFITAAWESERFFESAGGICDSAVIRANETGSMIVRPKVTSITPSRGGVGSVTRVTIDGSGFSSGATVSAGAGISVSVVSVTSTKIVADFTIAANAMGGNRNVTVSAARGPTSTPKTFFVQIPTSLSVVSVTILPTGTSQSTSGCITPSPGDYGIKVAIKYQVRDQNSTPAAITNDKMVAQEKVTNEILNGTALGDPVPNFQDITPSRIITTRSSDTNGQFVDAPFGRCDLYAITYLFTQNIRILIAGTQTTYDVRANYITVTSTASGQGSITNGVDIQKSRP